MCLRFSIDVINIHIWEGQSLALIFAPMISVLAVGYGWTGWKYRKRGKGPDNIPELGILTAGLLYIGSGAMMVMQIIIAASKANPGPAVLVTIIIALIPLILGYKLWEDSSDFKHPDKSQRAKVVVYGLVGFFVWAGLIIGPVIAIISGILPSKELN
ncbi:MAG: hypothetical protein V5A66_00750 [Candidatus Thermoplasmatota archaeon]